MLTFTDKGIYCPPGDFYIDPWQPVKKAVITHAHSDHARAGSENYLCHRDTVTLLKLRLGDHNYQPVEWGETVFINGVKVSLHPAGHIIGSSQIRVEYNGEVWVVSGDYKTEDDGISGAIEIVKCDVFITESTFGLPIYHWKSQQEIFTNIQNWIIKNRKAGKNSVLIGYSLGKAQRLLPCISAVSAEIFVHGAIWNVHETLLNAGFKLPAVKRVTQEMSKDDFKETIILAPPSADGSPWMKRFSDYELGVVVDGCKSAVIIAEEMLMLVLR